MTAPKLQLRELRIAFGPRTVVDLERLELGPGEILGLAGESGSGKSITALAVLGLASTLGARVQGSILFDGDIDGKYDRALAKIGISPAMLSSDAGHA